MALLTSQTPGVDHTYDSTQHASMPACPCHGSWPRYINQRVTPGRQRRAEVTAFRLDHAVGSGPSTKVAHHSGKPQRHGSFRTAFRRTPPTATARARIAGADGQYIAALQAATRSSKVDGTSQNQCHGPCMHRPSHQSNALQDMGGSAPDGPEADCSVVPCRGHLTCA